MEITYEQIKKANEEIETIKLGAKGYAQVNERIKAFRKVYPAGQIITQIEDIKENSVRIKTTIKNDEQIIATGTASETLTGDAKKDYINKTSMIENCETSSVGRALGFAGFGVDTSIASAEDIERNKEKRKLYEIYDDMYITEEEAKYIAKVTLADLMRKMGIIKVELDHVIEEELWTKIDDMTIYQLLKLETKLKTINMENNSWHELYNQNQKFKDVVPKNQEVVYETTNKKFGLMALKKAEGDQLLKSKIIDSYLNMGINLEAQNGL